MKKMLITGGAGFVGASLALLFKTYHPDLEIFCLDNLSRRGSELNLPRLQAYGVKFIHGDVRIAEDLAKLPTVDWLIECSAEPSVHAGFGESPAYLMNTNLNGLLNCLEFLRQKGGKLLFLSTSRVYPIQKLCDLPLTIKDQRMVLSQPVVGVSNEGINENFPLTGNRSLYGATKLCGELIIAEYAALYNIPSIINRCGVIAGPWQMGKVDQGFMALWVARHFFGGQLNYCGFGGEGLQVRDVLHVNDLFDLLQCQMKNDEAHQNVVYNVGGGLKNSLSLRELTQLVQQATGRNCEIGSDPQTRPADIPYYVTDNTLVTQNTAWQPQTSLPQIVEDIVTWIEQHASSLKPILTT
ncbi:MAG: NAD-dependent epimerase/dehydratase family protein [Proteobacteria bacterium]|nr:NAD-dependent epimerase/dehydratase family protein [Pseudomonadota bacterium]